MPSTRPGSWRWSATAPATPTGCCRATAPSAGAVGATVLADAGRLTAFATLKNPAAQTARNLAVGLLLRLPPIQALMASKLAETAIAYPHSPLNHNGAGDRMQPIPGEPPAGAGPRPRFILHGHATAATAALLNPQKDLLEPVVRPPRQHDTIHLLRPDGYIAMTGRQGDFDSIIEYLQALRK